MPFQKPNQEPSSESSRKKDEERARLRRERDKEAGERVAALVLAKIERPNRFRKAEGHLLWNNRFRVNIFVERDTEEGYVTGSTKIAESYFVVSDGDKILTINSR